VTLSGQLTIHEGMKIGFCDGGRGIHGASLI